VVCQVGRAVGILAKTFPELPAAPPPATPTLEQALMLLYTALRNKTETTSTAFKILNNAEDGVLTQASLADTTSKLTRGKLS